MRGIKMKYDCGFTKDNGWFRYKATAIIIENGSVLFAKNDRDDYYYPVGGGVHIGEKAEEAVAREVYEETGTHYEIDRLAFIHENFFIGSGSLEGYNCHEIAFYYLMKPRGTQKLNSNSYSGGFKEYMHWLPINNLSKYKAFPTFFTDKLSNIQSYVEHIVTDER